MAVMNQPETAISPTEASAVRAPMAIEAASQGVSGA